MMKRLICWLWGHRFVAMWNGGVYEKETWRDRCSRCGKAAQ